MIIALKGKRMVAKFGNCYGIKQDSEELENEYNDDYIDLGTIPEVVKIGFTQGFDAKYIQPSMEAIRRGLIEIGSNE